MHQVHPDVSLLNLLARFVAADVKIHLFASNTTPGPASVLGDFTEVGSGTGYAPVTVAHGDFTASGVSGGIATLTAPDVTFAVTSGLLVVYGYYVTDTGTTVLLAAGRFSGAPLTLDPSNPIAVTPKFATSSRFTS